jgi:hypothetical protein
LAVFIPVGLHIFLRKNFLRGWLVLQTHGDSLGACGWASNIS